MYFYHFHKQPHWCLQLSVLCSVSPNDQKTSFYQLCWATNALFILHLCTDLFITLVVVNALYLYCCRPHIAFLKCNSRCVATVDRGWWQRCRGFDSRYGTTCELKCSTEISYCHQKWPLVYSVGPSHLISILHVALDKSSCYIISNQAWLMLTGCCHGNIMQGILCLVRGEHWGIAG